LPLHLRNRRYAKAAVTSAVSFTMPIAPIRNAIVSPVRKLNMIDFQGRAKVFATAYRTKSIR
jgi:hypothetical protein